MVGARERGPQSPQEGQKEGWERVSGGQGAKRGQERERRGREEPPHAAPPTWTLNSPGAAGHLRSPGQVLSPVNWAHLHGSEVCGLSRTFLRQPHPCPLLPSLSFPSIPAAGPEDTTHCPLPRAAPKIACTPALTFQNNPFSSLPSFIPRYKVLDSLCISFDGWEN